MKRKLTAWLLILCMAIGLLPVTAAADNDANIGKVSVLNGGNRYFTSLPDLVNYVKELSDRSFTIDMLADWNNARLCIPSKAWATLNMHGHIYNRGLTKAESDGEVIWVGSDAKLTINGGSTNDERNIEHAVGVYHDWRHEGKADVQKTFRGGVIAGGYSTNGGGGIDVKSNCILTLNDVTIAGCRSEQSGGTDGYGGGIWVHGGMNEAGTVIMNYTTITGCYAYNSGGGLYQSNHNKFYMEMNQSHIDSNYCYSNGGGVYLGGASITLKGDRGSYISSNRTGGGKNQNGGGIYVNNDDVSVSGLIIADNLAYNGGGVFCDDKKITLSDCDIRDNYAFYCGGGVYICNNSDAINSCSIGGNESRNEGGGVYVESDVEKGFAVTGSTQIAGNRSGNLYLENGARANFALTKGAYVCLQYRDMPDTYQMVTEGEAGDTVKTTDCIRFLESDVSGYHFTFNSAPNQRKIYLVKNGYSDGTVGASYTPLTPIVISAEEATAEARTPVADYTVEGESGRAYDLYRGYYRYPSIEDPTANNTAVFYYSDGYFDASPAKYNEHLATMSTAMAQAGMYLQNMDYPYKHAAIRQLMTDIGVPEENVYVNAYNLQKPGTDTIGVAIGSRKLKDRTGEDTGYILIPVVVRGGGYEAEWASNMTLGSGAERNGEAQGFSEAADQVKQEIETYLDRYGLRDALNEGRIKFWVMGFSRAGATANITSKRLVEEYCCGGDSDIYRNQLFAYCIEAPQGGTDKAETLPSLSVQYDCIHNVINYADIVPLVGPSEMGFKRYGVDHFVPGTEAGRITYTRTTPEGAGSYSGVTTVTTQKDNNPIETKTSAYEALREQMLPQLRSMDSDIVFDDYFHLMEMNFISDPMFEEAGSYEPNEEWFIRSFLSVFQSSSLTSRDKWAVEKVEINGTTYNTMQQALRETCALVFGMDESRMQQFINKASRMASTISYVPLKSYEYGMIEIWDDVIGDWHTLSGATKQSYIDFIWDRLKATGAFQYLGEDDVGKLRNNFPTLLERILNYTDWDYAHTHVSCSDYSNMIWTGTFAANAGKILSNHYPEVDIAWQRAADSFYNGEVFDERNKEYKISLPDSIDVPGAFYTVTDEQGTHSERINTSAVVDLEGEQRLVLDVPELDGEAIYYSLNGGDWELFRGWIDLPLNEDEAFTSYYIRTYARWYDRNSQTTVYQVKLLSGKQPVTVITQIDGESGVEVKTETAQYASGETVALHADVPSGVFFLKWNIQTQSGKYVTNKLIPDPEQQKQTDVTFVMPEAGKGDFPMDYELTCTASYGERIGEIDIRLKDKDGHAEDNPTAGEPLPYWFNAVWNGTDHLYAGEWYLHMEDGSKILWDRDIPACNHTVYSAVITIPEERTMLFEDNLVVTYSYSFGATYTYSLDPTTRSVIFEITFPETGFEDDEFEPDLSSVFTLTIEQWNKNRTEPTKAAEDREVRLLKGHSITIDPSSIDNMAFDGWDSWIDAFDGMDIEVQAPADGTGRIILHVGTNAPDTASLTCRYVPLISRVEITVGPQNGADDWIPTATERADHQITQVMVTCGKTYEVCPVYDGVAFFRLNMSPSAIRIRDENGNNILVYNYNTVYTATVDFLKHSDPMRVLRYDLYEPEDFFVNGSYRLAEDAVILINGRSADVVNDAGTTVAMAFPKTESGPVKLTDYERPAEVIEVPHGSNRDTVRHEYLPEKLPITVDDGSFTEASVIWESIEPDPDPYPATLDEVVCTATGYLGLPFGVDSNGIDTSFSVQIIVRAADHCAAPTASVSSGTYPAAIDVTLSTETADGIIWYTTNGLTPGQTETFEYEEPIHITPDMVNEHGEFVIRAYTLKNKMNNSPESIFVYRFTNRIVPPEGDTLTYRGEPQIGVEASPFYTLIASDGSGVVIDDEGNATATNAGVYTVTAHIADGYVWKIGETEPQAEAGEPDENGTIPVEWITEDITTNEDQTITFTIGKASLEDAIVTAEDMAYTGEPLTPEVTVCLGDAPIPPAEYSVTFENNTEIGTATIRIRGNEINYTGTATGTFEILGAPEPKFAAHSLILSGQISVNFYMDLRALSDAERVGTYMTFTISGKGSVSSELVYFDESMLNSDVLYYKFTCYVNSIQMADTITATYHWFENGAEKTVSEDYSIKQYISTFDAKKESFDATTVALVHALADYGHYVQKFLSQNRGWQIGTDYAEMDLHFADSYDIDTIKTAVADYAIVKDDRTNGDLTAINYSLLLDSETAIKVYFTPSSDYTGTPAVTVDNQSYTATKTGRQWVVVIPNISAHKLIDSHVVVFTTTNGTATVTVSALSYVKGALDAYTDADSQNAMAAIYAYSKAAQDYKAEHPN